MQIKPYDIFGDYYYTLLDEYNSEDKNIYEHIYHALIPSQIREAISLNSNCENPIKSNDVTFNNIPISILIFRGYDYNECYFYTLFDMSNYVAYLINNENFKRFTKFCFYLESRIPLKTL